METRDLNPDGLSIKIDWEKFVPTSSVFIPCINTTECLRQVRLIARDNDWEVDYRIRIEGKHRGIRVWRIL